MALVEQDLVTMSADELDEIFRESPAGEIPDGEANGQVLLGSEHDSLSETAAQVTSTARLHEGGGGWVMILSDLKTLLETGSSFDS